MIRLFKVYMADEVPERVTKTLLSGYLGEGPMVQKFETAFGEYINNSNVVMVNSGTAAITMALRLADVGYGDYVATTPMTCLATNMPILSLGAIPFWIDILSDGTMNPENLRECFEWQKPKPKAILCMDWGGLPCMLSELKDIANINDVPLIEDACQSIGAEYNGRSVGNDADFVCWSFQAIKHLTTGDGGCLTINGKPDLLEKAKLMRWFGLDRTNGKDMRCSQDPPFWGYKFHMNDIAATIGLTNLEQVWFVIRNANSNAQKYNKYLIDCKNVELLPNSRERKSGYWLYTIFVEDVSDFITYMKENGVEASRVHDRNDTKSIFESSKFPLPGVDYFDKHHVCIPVGWWMQPEDLDKVIELCQGY